MREVAIAGDAEDFRTEFIEFLHAFTESDELSWAHVSEIEGIEDEDDPFTLQVGEGQLSKTVVFCSWQFLNDVHTLK